MTTFAPIGTVAADTNKKANGAAILPIVVVAMIVAVTVGLYFAPTFTKALTEQSAFGSGNAQSLATMSASRKVRCIMPPAWRRDCEP